MKQKKTKSVESQEKSGKFVAKSVKFLIGAWRESRREDVRIQAGKSQEKVRKI